MAFLSAALPAITSAASAALPAMGAASSAASLLSQLKGRSTPFTQEAGSRDLGNAMPWLAGAGGKGQGEGEDSFLKQFVTNWQDDRKGRTQQPGATQNLSMMPQAPSTGGLYDFLRAYNQPMGNQKGASSNQDLAQLLASLGQRQF